MNINSILAVSESALRQISYIGQIYNGSLNWIGKAIRGLIENAGSVGIGIILFSVILRLIVLPFDAYQRVSMRKQNVKMQENQEKLEKLQKQYANDKEMYNKKMMEMYKANGISMFSSCLPMILSLVIFIVAINAYNAYSGYAMLKSYNAMVEAYNGELASYTVTIDDTTATVDDSFQIAGKDYVLFYSADDNKIIYSVVEKDKYDTATQTVDDGAKISYFVDTDKVYAQNTTAIEELRKYTEKDEDGNDVDKLYEKEDTCLKFVENTAKTAVKTAYDEEISDTVGFLWIKNIWITDASYKHPVEGYDSFKSSLSRISLITENGKVKFGKIGDYGTDAYTQTTYNNVTQELSEAKKSANGWYVLILLSIGTILLQQFVTMRSQKAQNKFSTVDGQGAMSQKTMMIMMTVMFAFFSFMYSAAFSIYMIMSNVLSLITTLIINFIVEKVMDKQAEKKLQEQYNKRFPGRKGKTK